MKISEDHAEGKPSSETLNKAKVGKTKHSGHRQGVANLLTPEESKKSLDLAINAWQTRGELAPKIGKGKYVLAEYEKLKRITMRLGDSLYYY